jgi:hypothetical protein
MSQQPSVGRIVQYQLGAQDAVLINQRRVDAEAYRRANPRPDVPGEPGASGHIAHVGNHAAAGQVFPALVVRVFDPSVSTVNLQVILDGNDTYWATSRMEGDEPNQWSWPPRV